MFFKYIYRALIPAVLDVVIETLKELAIDSETTVDDELVKTIEANKEQIVKLIIDKL